MCRLLWKTRSVVISFFEPYYFRLWHIYETYFCLLGIWLNTMHHHYISTCQIILPPPWKSYFPCATKAIYQIGIYLLWTLEWQKSGHCSFRKSETKSTGTYGMWWWIRSMWFECKKNILHQCMSIREWCIVTLLDNTIYMKKQIVSFHCLLPELTRHVQIYTQIPFPYVMMLMKLTNTRIWRLRDQEVIQQCHNYVSVCCNTNAVHVKARVKITSRQFMLLAHIGKWGETRDGWMVNEWLHLQWECA
jgi:hypothetical protein